MKKVAVIGNGAVGLCTAWFLNQEGFEVTVISESPQRDGKGCSYGNAGLIVPSHFTPMACPGAVVQGLKWMLNSRSPLYIKPRLNAELWRWMWLFARSATANHVQRSASILKDCNEESRELFGLFSDFGPKEFGFKRKGLLMLSQTEASQKEEQHLARRAEDLGMPVQVLDRGEVHKMEPDALPEVCGGVYYPDDAQLDPARFMDALTTMLKLDGIKFSLGNRVKGFESRAGRVSHVVTKKMNLAVDHVVVCAGVWSGELAKQLQTRLPLEAGKGYSFEVPGQEYKLHHPSILCESRIALTPMGERLRVAGTMELGGKNTKISEKRVQSIRDGVKSFVPGWDGDGLDASEVWGGLRPVSPDGLPYVGKLTGWNNAWVNSGHAMMGLSLAPVCGKRITYAMAQKKGGALPAEFSPSRFA